MYERIILLNGSQSLSRLGVFRFTKICIKIVLTIPINNVQYSMLHNPVLQDKNINLMQEDYIPLNG